jgi:hypothetical protein
LIVKSSRLRFGLAGQIIERRVGDDQAVRGAVGRRLVEHHPVFAVAPARHQRSRLGFQPRRRSGTDARRSWEGRAIDRRDPLNHVRTGHAFCPFVTIVDDDPEQLIVVEAKENLLDRIH